MRRSCIRVVTAEEGKQRADPAPRDGRRRGVEDGDARTPVWSCSCQQLVHHSGMIAFTLCSNGFLAHAKTLGDSFLLHNPGTRFVIGLVDRRRGDIDYDSLGAFEILPVEDIAAPCFEDMWHRYNTLELITSLKPFYFEYLFWQSRPDAVLYFDSDCELYASCQSVFEELGDGTILLTPHALTPKADDGRDEDGPGLLEAVFLNYGVYNLGFLAVADRPGRAEFLRWWKARTARLCYIRPSSGLFVDQLWINLAPVFFAGVRVSGHPGLNMAYWNLHERTLTQQPNGNVMVNDTDPLVFFHFSSLDPRLPEAISRWQDRFTLQTRPDLDALFCGYAERLLKNGYESFQLIECAFAAQRKAFLAERALHEYGPATRAARVVLRRPARALRRVLGGLDAVLLRVRPGRGKGRG